MPYFYLTISGGGVIEAANVNEAKTIGLRYAMNYTSVVGAYETDKHGIALNNQCSDCGGDIPAPGLICHACAVIEATQEG